MDNDTNLSTAMLSRSVQNPNPCTNSNTEKASAHQLDPLDWFSDEFQRDNPDLWLDTRLDECCSLVIWDLDSHLTSTEKFDFSILDPVCPVTWHESWESDILGNMDWSKTLGIDNDCVDEPGSSSLRAASISTNYPTWTTNSTSTDESSILSPSPCSDISEKGSKDESRSRRPRTTANPRITPSANDWPCPYPNCHRSFPQRNKLNRHQKYHNKPHRYLEPDCLTRRVAFSLEKDLVRHETQHNGRRFYCCHADCSFASGEENGGFSRKDNLKRHLANQHQLLNS